MTVWTDLTCIDKKKVLLKDFVAVLQSDETIRQAIEKLKEEVEEFASGFYMPGDDDS